MIDVLKRFGAAVLAAVFFVAVFFVAARADTPAGEGTLAVTLDQATIIRLPDRVATIVVGNPLIADVTLQPGNIAVLTGKGYGVTNMMALDRSGAVLTEKSIEVKRPDSLVTVYKGVLRESYNCARVCEPRNTLGDAPIYFNTTLNQISTRNGISQGMSSEK